MKYKLGDLLQEV